MQMTTQPNKRNWKKSAKKKVASKPWKQRFGPGMLVEHEKLGLGAVTSSFKWHICVHFFMTGHTETVNQRELTFTREESARRRKIARALEGGKPVASASDVQVGDRVVHELNGFGTVYEETFGEMFHKDPPDAHLPEPGETVLVSFENDYITDPVRINVRELRIDVPVVMAEPEKKNRNRRR